MPYKKILLGLTYYLPNISGVTQYAVILAEELVKRNYGVKVVCAKNKNDLSALDDLNGVKIHRVGGTQISKGFVMPLYPFIVMKDVYTSDIVNCHLPSTESFWLALWAKIFSKKLVVTHHCEFNFTGTFGNQIISWITFPIHWLVYILADEIVSYTKDYADTSVFLRHFKNKTTFILPPILVEKPTKKIDLGKKKIVGFVGRIGWEKGLQYLIEAMEGVDAKLVLVGPYKEVVGDNTYEIIKNKRNIVFYGPLPHKELKAFYDICDCLVLPSTNNLETFGIVQAEAMKCGCPVVASNLPGVRVPVTMTRMGEIAKIGDSKDLRSKIVAVLNNGRSFYKKRAKELHQFDYKLTVDKYEKLFRD